MKETLSSHSIHYSNQHPSLLLNQQHPVHFNNRYTNKASTTYMSCQRTVIRVPQVCRVAKAVTPSSTRNMAYFPTPFFPRFPSSTSGGDFAPPFRLLEDYTSSRIFDSPSSHVRAPTFQPRFDVKEIKDSYELRGELPGVDQKDIEVQFTDDQTLTIRGRSERESYSGTAPVETHQHQEQLTSSTPAVDSDAVSTHSDSSYQKPSVEDENGVSSGSATPAQATPRESAAEQQQQETTGPQGVEQGTKVTSQAPSPRYWVSERSIGEFERTFSFPSRVNQEAVKASLKNGILSIVVPKAVAPGARKINIE